MPFMFDPHDTYGYPAEIDALAIRLARLAQKVQHGADAIEQAMRKMEFEGPKAQDIRQRASENRRRTQDIVSRLQELSHTTFQSGAFSNQKLYEFELAEERMKQGLNPP